LFTSIFFKKSISFNIKLRILASYLRFRIDDDVIVDFAATATSDAANADAAEK
jgi:hypothetical protein